MKLSVAFVAFLYLLSHGIFSASAIVIREPAPANASPTTVTLVVDPPPSTSVGTSPPETTCVLADGATVIVVGGGPCPIHEPPPTSRPSVTDIPPPTTTVSQTITQDCFLPNGQTIKGPCPSSIPTGSPTTCITSGGVTTPTTTTYIEECFLPNGQTIQGPCPTTSGSVTVSAPPPTATLVPTWGQCGGTGFIGSTVCVDGTYCKYMNDWFSQCLPNGD